MPSFFYAFALPLVACATGWALFFLPSKSTGWLIRLDVGLAWFAALATLILVPADVASALAGEPPGDLAVWWRASYWYSFAVMVIVLPVHMEFARSGEFSVKDQLLAAARTNLKYYAVLLAVATSGLVLLLVTGHLAPANVLGFCIAFSNAYGLVAAIFLLGFGLVAVPKQLWLSADLHGEQRRVCHQAGLQAERALAAHRRLSAAVLTARRASVLFAAHDPLRPLMDAVLDLANSVGPGFTPDPGVRVPDESELDVFDRHDLARLRAEVKAALQDWERERALYVETVVHHLRLEATVARAETGLPHAAPLAARLEWLWQCHMHVWAFRLLAAAAALCSMAIVVAEATIAGVLPNLSIVSVVLRNTAGSPFATELLCFLFLAYPCTCAYYSLYRLGRFAFYRMVPRHTDAYSLCYSALLMCRFAAPLAFNFMAAIAMPEARGQEHAPDVTNTVFYAEIGQLMMRQPLIGWQFTTFAPILLVPYILLLASGVFGHVTRLFKRGDSLEFEDDWQLDSHAAMGRRLLRLESDNARQGLAPGQAIEAAAAPSGTGGAGNLAGVSGATSGLLGTLRGAAAAAAAEEADERRQSRGGWLARLLPGRGSEDGGSGEAAEGLRASVEAARSRLSRLVAPSAVADSYRAGYADLPASPGTSPPTSRGMPAASRPPRPSGPGGSGADLLSGSPGVRLSGGGLKAARAAYLARGSGGALASGGGVAGVRRGSVDVESPGSASS